uniref:Uncharacterized protein n=1 Tax=Arion vulgaris TaxID=1028688 RepID=A0A0B7AWU3_9EUPU
MLSEIKLCEYDVTVSKHDAKQQHILQHDSDVFWLMTYCSLLVIEHRASTVAPHLFWLLSLWLSWIVQHPSVPRDDFVSKSV